MPPLIAGFVLAMGAVALIWTFRPSRRRRAGNLPVIAPTAPALAQSNGVALAAAAPAALKPAALPEPASQRHAAQTPAAKRPAAQKPAAKKRAAKKPVAQKRAATNPAAPGPPVRRRRSETLLLSAADRTPAAPAASALPAAPAPSAAPAATAAAAAPAASAAAGVDPPRALPPDPRRAWSAQIEWQEAGSESRFVVLARTGRQADDAAVVAESPVLEWPPASDAAVQALTEAVAELERKQLAAGWTALDPGAGWYAKRFAWKPVIVVEPAPPAVEQAAVRAAARPAPPPPPASPPASDQAPDRPARFVRAPAWPAGTSRMWRCELRWEPGVVNSRFEAVAYEPGKEAGARPVASSSTFKWLMMADPNPAAEEYREEIRRMGAALQTAGWEHVGRGAKWYAARFVWRRTGKPPDEIAISASSPATRE